MFATSELYKEAVADSSRTSKLRGTLTDLNGKVTEFSDDDILKDTVYITNQSTNNSDFEYGCVYCGECGLTIKTEVDKYTLYDAELKLYWSLLLSDGTWEEIPLGVYQVSEPKRINDKISIKALDKMTLLDVSIEDSTTGTAFELLSFLAEKCKITLAQTEEEILTFPNASELYSLVADRVDTYRDLVAYICMVCACFATFDRYGNLKLVKYATEPSLTLDKKQRFLDASFSDYTTSFIGIEARFIANENYAPYEEFIEGTGLILNMGDIPIVQGLPELKHQILKNVLDILQNVKYTPCELQIISNPTIELGDMIANNNVGLKNSNYTSLVTYYNWNYRGKHKLKSIGGNPKLNGVNSKEYKRLADLEASIAQKTLGVNTYTNAQAYNFSNRETNIIRLQYSVSEEATPLFFARVPLEMSLDGEVIFRFYIDNILHDDRTLTTFLSRGKHVVVLFDYYNDEANERHEILVSAEVAYFESDERQQQAEIDTHNNFLTAIAEPESTTVENNIVVFPAYDIGVIDTTLAQCNILSGKIKAAVYAQGIVQATGWDGTINFSDSIELLTFTPMSMFELTDSVIVSRHVPQSGGNISESTKILEFAAMSLGIGEVVDTLEIVTVIERYIFDTVNKNNYIYNAKLVDTSDGFAYRTKFIYNAVAEPIDMGTYQKIEIDIDGVAVESVVLE